MGKIINKFQAAIILLIKGYQYFMSPLLGSRCRFYPSCSHYAQEALEVHGFFTGCCLSLKRLMRCHPWHPGGVDLIPEPKHKC